MGRLNRALVSTWPKHPNVELSEVTRRLLAAFLALLVSLLSQEASAWIENKIEAAHVRRSIGRV